MPRIVAFRSAKGSSFRGAKADKHGLHIGPHPSVGRVGPLAALAEVGLLELSHRVSGESFALRVDIDAGVHQYWTVDPETRAVTIIRPDEPDRVETKAVTWAPSGASESLRFEVAELF